MRRMFSEKQIKKIVEEGNLSISGNLEVEGTINSDFEEYPMTPNQLFVEGGYFACVRENNVLWVIIAGSIPQQEANIGSITVASINIPSDIASKLHTITTGSGGTSEVLTMDTCKYQSGSSYYDVVARVTLNASGTLGINCYIGHGATGNVNYISIRVPLILK